MDWDDSPPPLSDDFGTHHVSASEKAKAAEITKKAAAANENKVRNCLNRNRSGRYLEKSARRHWGGRANVVCDFCDKDAEARCMRCRSARRGAAWHVLLVTGILSVPFHFYCFDSDKALI